MENITLGQLAIAAGTIMTIFGLVSLVIKPFLSINKSLMQTTKILDELQKEISYSIDDRKELHKQVERNDKRIDEHDKLFVEHNFRINNLEKRK